MRTFLAFKYYEEIDETNFEEALNRVKAHYYESGTKNVEIITSGIRSNNIGAYVIDLVDSPLLWPNLYEENGNYIITYSPPSNWKEFCPSHQVEDGPKELLSHILSCKYENN